MSDQDILRKANEEMKKFSESSFSPYRKLSKMIDEIVEINKTAIELQLLDSLYAKTCITRKEYLERALTIIEKYKFSIEIDDKDPVELRRKAYQEMDNYREKLEDLGYKG